VTNKKFEDIISSKQISGEIFMLLSFSAFFFLGKTISTVQGAAHCYIW